MLNTPAKSIIPMNENLEVPLPPVSGSIILGTFSTEILYVFVSVFLFKIIFSPCFPSRSLSTNSA